MMPVLPFVRLSWLLLLPAAAAEPPEAMKLARRAYEQAQAGQFPEAIAGLRQAARLAPANALYRSALGGIHERQGQLEEAVAAFGEAARLDPNDQRIRAHFESVSLDWGAVLAREHRFRAGLVFARETAARFAGSARAQLMLGLFLTRNQHNLAAVDAYRRALTLDPASADASVGLGIAQSSAGMVKEALATFEAGLVLFPADAMHRQALGVLLARLAETGDAAAAERARAMLESALAIDPKLAEAHYQLGSLALARGDARAAIVCFDAAAEQGLDDSRLHYAAARALRRAGRGGDAEARLQLFRQRKASEQLP